MAIEYDYTVDYNEQMLNYYPEFIKAIREFQVLIKTQSAEIDDIHKELDKILANAYVETADEDKILEWEQLLGINPLPQGEDTYETWLQDRREVILARLFTMPKLNSEGIADLVNIFTNGDAKSFFKDGVIHIFVYPPRGNKQYKFENIEQEISKKIPTHLTFEIKRAYRTWGQISVENTYWDTVHAGFENWEDVLLDVK